MFILFLPILIILQLEQLLCSKCDKFRCICRSNLVNSNTSATVQRTASTTPQQPPSSSQTLFSRLSQKITTATTANTSSVALSTTTDTSNRYFSSNNDDYTNSSSINVPNNNIFNNCNISDMSSSQSFIKLPPLNDPDD